MRKLLLILALPCLLLASCDKKEVVSSATPNTSTTDPAPVAKTTPTTGSVIYDRLAFVQLPIEQQKELYNGMTPENRYELWKDKIRNLREMATFDADQVATINELDNRITYKEFDITSEEYQTFMSDFMSGFNLKARQYFSIEQLYYAFGSLEDYNAVAAGPQPPVIDRIKNCNCSKAVNLCGTQVACAGSCAGSEIGCGYLWLYSCNGRCDFSQ
ncbi:MAG: bacteriocin fulvocin C-related protein [Bacteroidia bacterium]|nr:bacteriocin fulvocin C-related protein [Bacteroidia bacterium]